MVEKDKKREVIEDIRRVFGWNEDANIKRKTPPLRRQLLKNMNGTKRMMFTRKRDGYEGVMYHGRGGVYYYGEDGRVALLLKTEETSEITVAVCTWSKEKKTMYAYDIPIISGIATDSFGIDDRMRFFETEWLRDISGRLGDKFRIKPIRYHSRPEKILEMKDRVIIVDAIAKMAPGREEDVWMWESSRKIHMRLKWNRKQIGAETWYFYELWCKSVTGNAEIKFTDLCHMKSIHPPTIPHGAVVECEYDANRKTFSDRDMSWSKGMWNVRETNDHESRTNDAKEIWTKVSLQREDLSLKKIMVACAENQRLNEENVEWIDVI